MYVLLAVQYSFELSTFVLLFPNTISALMGMREQSEKGKKKRKDKWEKEVKVHCQESTKGWLHRKASKWKL